MAVEEQCVPVVMHFVLVYALSLFLLLASLHPTPRAAFVLLFPLPVA